MSSLSLRKLPENVEKALLKEAKRLKKTKTEIVIMALERLLDLGQRAHRLEELTGFFGKLSDKDYANLKQLTAQFEKIDPEMWK